MINLANLLELVASYQPIEVIDIETKTCINPKQGQIFLYPFNEYEVLNICTGINEYKNSYIFIAVRRDNYVKSK